MTGHTGNGSRSNRTVKGLPKELSHLTFKKPEPRATVKCWGIKACKKRSKGDATRPEITFSRCWGQRQDV